MAIQRFQFRVCEACGARVRTGGQAVFRVLCPACAAAEEAGKPLPQKEVTTSDSEGEDWTLDEARPRELAGAEGKAETVVEGVGVALHRTKRMAEAGSTPERPLLTVKVSRWAWLVVWLAVFGCAVLAVLAGIGNLRRLGTKVGKVEKVLMPWEKPVPLDDPLLTVLPELEGSITVASRFLDASDVDAMLPSVRGGDKMRAMVEKLLPSCRPTKGAKERLSQMPPVVEADMAYQCFGLIEDSGVGRLVAVVPTKEGPRVDFKAYSEWSDVPFGDLFEGKAKQADELRLMLRFSNYYNFQFAEQAAYVAFDASASSDSTTSVTMYARRGSEIEQRLSWAMGRLGFYPATVAVEAVNGSEKHRQYLITRLLALGYVVPGEE